MKNCCDLNLGESLCIYTFFLFPDSGLNLENDFDFLILIYFEWRDTENHQLEASYLLSAMAIISLNSHDLATNNSTAFSALFYNIHNFFSLDAT